jgi:hypothetical protein
VRRLVLPLSSIVRSLWEAGGREPAWIGIFAASTVHIPEKMLPAAQ